MRVFKENSNRYRKLKRSLWGDPTGKIKTFAIVSPENPLGWENSTDDEFREKFAKWRANFSTYNRKAVDELKTTELLRRIEKTGNDTLQYGGFQYVPIKGEYKGKEKSFVIFNIPYKDAEAIASNFGQESFFYGKVYEDHSEIGYYETHNSCHTYKLVDVSKTVTDETDAEDFFSRFGVKFRINMGVFGDKIPDIVDIAEFERSMNEVYPFKERSVCRRHAYRKND